MILTSAIYFSLVERMKFKNTANTISREIAFSVAYSSAKQLWSFRTSSSIACARKKEKRKEGEKLKIIISLLFSMFSVTLASLRSNGALAVGHTPLGIGSSGRPRLNVSYVERAGVGWRN